MKPDYDVIVIGAGVVGLSSAYNLSLTSHKSLLLEQFSFGHTRGSSHGHSRLSKFSHLKSFASKITPNAHKTWEQINKASGLDFIVNNGHLAICHDSVKEKLGIIAASLNSSTSHYQLLSGSELHNQYPGLKFDESFHALHESNGIVIKADRALAALKNLYLKAGGTYRDGEKVLNIQFINENHVRVQTSKQIYNAKSVIVTCGPWFKEIANQMGVSVLAEPVRVTAYYWKETNPGSYAAANKFPPLMVHFEKYHLYSTPSLEYPGLIKICYHHRSPVNPNRPDDISNIDLESEKKRLVLLKKMIKDHFCFLEEEPVLKELYLQTVTPDSTPIIDRHPRFPNIIFGGAFSGYGFGPAPEFGRILCDLATNKSVPTPFKELSFQSHFERCKL